MKSTEDCGCLNLQGKNVCFWRIFLHFHLFERVRGGRGWSWCQHCRVVFNLLNKFKFFSSQEPDAKRQRVDDGSGAAALTDAQAQNSAYNYNWYQVLLLSNYQNLLYVLYVTFLWSCLHISFFFFFFLSSSTVVGDRTPGGNTPSITSITNIILLPQHDGEKFQHGDSEERIFSCLTLNRTLQLVVMEISVQPPILICSFWFVVWNQLNLVANSLK